MGKRSFTREFKFEGVKLESDCGMTVQQAAQDLGLHEKVLLQYKQRF